MNFLDVVWSWPSLGRPEIAILDIHDRVRNCRGGSRCCTCRRSCVWRQAPLLMWGRHPVGHPLYQWIYTERSSAQIGCPRRRRCATISYSRAPSAVFYGCKVMVLSGCRVITRDSLRRSSDMAVGTSGRRTRGRLGVRLVQCCFELFSISFVLLLMRNNDGPAIACAGGGCASR